MANRFRVPAFKHKCSCATVSSRGPAFRRPASLSTRHRVRPPAHSFGAVPRRIAVGQQRWAMESGSRESFARRGGRIANGCGSTATAISCHHEFPLPAESTGGGSNLLSSRGVGSESIVGSRGRSLSRSRSRSRTRSCSRSRTRLCSRPSSLDRRGTGSVFAFEPTV